MGKKKMVITIMEAKDMRNVRYLFKMKPYAEVSVNRDPKRKQRTPVDKHGKTNPAWYSVTSFTVTESELQQLDFMLVIKLYCSRKAGDRYIGEVHASIKDLYEQASVNEGGVLLTNRVKRGSAESKGELTFSCRFGDERTADADAEAEPPSSADERAVGGAWRWIPVGACFGNAALESVDLSLSGGL